ncbi:YqjF family protein [Sinomicrobium sp.]
MSIRDILHKTSHRPWPIPSGNWKYYQEWNDAVFLHWQVELSELRPWVPQELQIDLLDGKPWVSVVAFNMEKIRPRYLPAFPPISDFHEINIRTYVRSGTISGVYFLSIEGGTALSCKIAKALSGLPYRFSDMKRTPNTYQSFNAPYNDHFYIRYTSGPPLSIKSQSDLWLTERYALFQDSAHHINTFQIHHIEWPVQELQIHDLKVDYPRFESLLKGQPDKVHYSPGVRVLAWGREK